MPYPSDPAEIAAGIVDTTEPDGLNEGVGAPPAAPVTISRCTSIGGSSLGLGGLEAQLMDPVVPVFMVAMALIKECLWKEQVGTSERGNVYSK